MSKNKQLKETDQNLKNGNASNKNKNGGNSGNKNI